MKIIVFFLFTLILPMIFGGIIERITKSNFKDICSVVAFRYVMGNVVQWAIFQVLAVPLILLKVNFMVLVCSWTIVVAVILVGNFLYTKKGKYDWKSKISFDDKHSMTVVKGLCAVIAILVILYQCYMYVRYMHLDEDDSRFVVNAVDAYFNKTMLLTNPTTGEYMGTWVGDLAKDVASPWMIYVAMIAKLSMIHPTIVAHTLLPGLLLIASYCAYYLLGNLLLDGNTEKSAMFVMIVAFVNMYFCDSVYLQSFFSLVRIWQGKATLAAVMIPFLLYLLMRLYYEDNKRNYILVLISCIGMCLLSGMGIFFSGIMAATYCMYIILVRKKWKEIPLLLMVCIPTVLYGMVYLVIK